MNYAELLAALQNITADDDAEFVAEIPSLIRRAETRLARDLDLEYLEELIDLPVTAGSRWVPVPPDVLTATSLWRYATPLVPPGEDPPETPPPPTRLETIEERGYDYCLEYAPDEVEDTGWPKYFAEMRAPSAEPEPPPPPPPESSVTAYSALLDEFEFLEYGSPTGVDDPWGFGVYEPIAPTFPDLYELETGDPWSSSDPIIPEGVIHDAAYFVVQTLSELGNLGLAVRSYESDIADISAAITGPDAAEFEVSDITFSGDSGVVSVDFFAGSGEWKMVSIALTVTLADGSSHVIVFHPYVQFVAF